MSERVGIPIDEVISSCRRLCLKYVREQVEEVMLTPGAQRWDPTDVLRLLPVAEAQRDRSTIEVGRKRAHFPTGKTFDAGSSHVSSIPPNAQHALRSLEWIIRRESSVVAGPGRTGKSHLLEVLGHGAIDERMVVARFSVEDLGALVRRHRFDATYEGAQRGVLLQPPLLGVRSVA
jgi:DNA replication protein DnaC